MSLHDYTYQPSLIDVPEISLPDAVCPLRRVVCSTFLTLSYVVARARHGGVRHLVGDGGYAKFRYNCAVSKAKNSWPY